MGLGLGLGIWWPIQTSIIPGLLKALCARATYCENKLCTTATLEEIAAVRYTPPPPPTGILLVDYPGAAAAYSLRNLIDTTTSVVRVRRSNDNTEQDFSAAEITDGTLTTFTGANDGFVTTWYDQSGNNKHAVQATASEQPKIVDNGVVILENGKSGIVWSGDKRLLITSLNVQNSKRFTQISVFKTSNKPNELDWILSGYNSNNFGIAFQNNINESRFLFDGSWRNASGMITEVNTQYLRSIYRTSDTSANVYNNENSYLSNVIGDTSYNNIPIAIGNHLYQDESPLDFIIQEIIIYPTDQSTNRTGIETNINTEYTIY